MHANLNEQEHTHNSDDVYKNVHTRGVTKKWKVPQTLNIEVHENYSTI